VLVYGGGDTEVPEAAINRVGTQFSFSVPYDVILEFNIYARKYEFKYKNESTCDSV
jgi:hypothetical protein